MSYFESESVSITTDAGGDATVYTGNVNGRIVACIYTKTDFATGVDFTITGETSGQTIWTELDVDASVTVAPRQATHDTAGVASLYAAAGEPVENYVALADERIKVVIANGGNAKTGSIRFIWG